MVIECHRGGGMPATTATNRILLGGLNLTRPHDGTKKKKKAGAD